jgi:hypothetical protein
MAIEVGTLLEVTTASGDLARMRATSAPTRGRDFPVVWVCTEQEYEQAQASGRPVAGMPWPLDAVKELSGHGVTATAP